MRQPKRNFVIEYKSGRRRSVNTQTSSIWGNLDLKSVAQAVETDMPTQSAEPVGPVADASLGHSAQGIVAETNAPTKIIFPTDGEPAVERADPVTPMAHDTMIDGEEPIGVNDAKGSAEGHATGEPTRSEPSVADNKRRSVRQAGAGAGRKPVNPISTMPKLASFSEADKELADLVQLEEENRQLRRLLVTKLRQENAWLSEQLQRG